MMSKAPGIIFALIFLLILALLPACNSDGRVNSSSPEAPSMLGDSSDVIPAEPQKTSAPQPAYTEDIYAAVDPSGQVIAFWHPFTGEKEIALLEIISEFNTANQWGITVMPEYQGGYSDIFDKMLAFMNTAEAPEILMAFPEQAATYQLSKALINMDELVYSPAWGLKPGEIADFFPGFFQKDIFPTFGRQRLEIPLSGSMQVLYYNQNWLSELGYSEPPATPQDFREMACAAAVQPFSGATAEGRTGYQLYVNAANQANWIFAFGGIVFQDAAVQYNYTNPAAIAAQQFIQSLADEGCLTLVAEDHGDRKAFSQGTALFTVDTSADLSRYQSEVDANAQFQWSVAPLPHTASDPIQNISGASVSIARSSLEQQLAAWLFVKSFLDPAVQARWAQVSGDFPVRASALAGLSEYLATHPAYAAAATWLPYGIAEPSVPGYGQVRDLATEALFAITQGAEVAGVLKTLTVDANANLAEQASVIPKSSDPWVDVNPSGQTITFWHQQAPARHAVLDEIIAKFNNTNEWGISLVPEYQGTAAELYQKTLTSLEDGSGPGLVEAYQDQAAAYHLSGRLSDLTGLVKSIKWGLSPQEQVDFFPGAFRQDVYPNFGNLRLGFPLHRSIQVLYYNADWLAELKAAGVIDFDGPPATPEQFQIAACAAVENPFRNTTATSSLGYELNTDAATFTTWNFAFGGQVYDDQLALYSYNQPASASTAGFLRDLIDQGCAERVRERFEDQANFAQGATLFVIGSGAGLPFYQSAVSEEADFELGVAAIPYTTPEPVMNLSGISFSLPHHSPEGELAAWLFIKYFTSPEIQAQWAQASGYFPVRTVATQELNEYLAANPNYATIYALLPFGATEPSTPGYAAVRKMVAEALDVILDGERAQPILDQLNQDANLNLVEQLPR